MLRHISIRLFVGTALLALVAGCNSQTSVSGKVTYKGTPVSTGSVTLVASNGQVYTGNLNSDGTFQISDVPTGEVQIGIVGANPGSGNKPPPARGGRGPAGVGRGGGEGNPEGRGAAEQGTGPVIPAQYGDPRTSGLTGKVKAGEPLNIDLN
ncbi:MAG TPA: hypothetical protein VHR66_13245 [Gemmataceae bacterium]|jgi:hypothetical protein|nr:hypothetical protein [Gemmataceae bacterium]